MDIKSIILGAIGLLLGGGIVLATVAVTHTAPATTAPPFGALAGPDIPSPYLTFGNVREWAIRTDTLNTASTTICSLTSPAATSTLLYAAVFIKTGTTTAMAVDLTKGSAIGATASTTSRFNGTSLVLAANVGNSFVASSTNLGSDLDTFKPSTNLNVIMDSGLGVANFAPTGNCEAVWKQVAY